MNLLTRLQMLNRHGTCLDSYERASLNSNPLSGLGTLTRTSSAWGAGRIGRDNAYLLPASIGIVLVLMGYAIATGNWCTGSGYCTAANVTLGELLAVIGGICFIGGCIVIYRHWKKSGWDRERF